MNKAFIFDMDGVLINSEHEWHIEDTRIFKQFFDDETIRKIGETTGLGVRSLHERAIEVGGAVAFETFADAYKSSSHEVYERSPITVGVDALINTLATWSYKMAVVSASPQADIDRVIPRIAECDKFECTLSLAEHPTLRPKPAPDGYHATLKELGADPQSSFILEDSNYGIEAAKATGCFVIGFSGNLHDGYEQKGADDYANTMEEVAQIVERRAIRP